MLTLSVLKSIELRRFLLIVPLSFYSVEIHIKSCRSIVNHLFYYN